MGPTKLKRLQEQYKDVHLVIIDEFSMVSCEISILPEILLS
ncbi:hypothetical protein PPTG_20740 [Phytophthora nicotianae INRA-310]|uniref:Uncharacterized protein n=1 Tax=Phytophthora nicotianae (strain INRA-310) TaxID=761204 RepID=W2RF32_PHYN3|nr:hypothetical protein PPTG_20740 [Phytophthora nicotianae INRA-310]ETN23992.1 hypothetical protein PPTG_20740 [Phytophthora nicotianae INRA-310]